MSGPEMLVGEHVGGTNTAASIVEPEKADVGRGGTLVAHAVATGAQKWEGGDYGDAGSCVVALVRSVSHSITS